MSLSFIHLQPTMVEECGSAWGWGCACERKQVENGEVALIVFSFSSRPLRAFFFFPSRHPRLAFEMEHSSAKRARRASRDETLKHHPLSSELRQEAPLSFRVCSAGLCHRGVGDGRGSRSIRVTLATLHDARKTGGHQPGCLSAQSWIRLLRGGRVRLGLGADGSDVGWGWGGPTADPHPSLSQI